MRRVDARDMAWATGLVVAATAGWAVRERLASGALTRTSVRRRLDVTNRPRDRRLAAGALRNMVTAPGTATWVRAPGDKALHALFPGDCRLRTDEQGDDAGDVVVAFTDHHVSSGIWSVPEGFTIPGARAAGVVIDAATGYTVTCMIWPVSTENGEGPPVTGQEDPVVRWREAMDRLGRVRTVRVTP